VRVPPQDSADAGDPTRLPDFLRPRGPRRARAGAGARGDTTEGGDGVAIASLPLQSSAATTTTNPPAIERDPPRPASPAGVWGHEGGREGGVKGTAKKNFLRSKIKKGGKKKKSPAARRGDRDEGTRGEYIYTLRRRGAGDRAIILHLSRSPSARPPATAIRSRRLRLRRRLRLPASIRSLLPHWYSSQQIASQRPASRVLAANHLRAVFDLLHGRRSLISWVPAAGGGGWRERERERERWRRRPRAWASSPSTSTSRPPACSR
jgi:hypothetical protein